MKRKTGVFLITIAATLALCAQAQWPPPPPPQGGRPPRPDGGRGDGQRYSIEQAISDRAQLTTVAFSGLAFITGSFGCDTFLPPGKVCDFFGFQYMRDVQPEGMGHNTDFLTRIANNMIYALSDEQLAQLVALGREQEGQVKELALKRFPLIQAFRQQLEGDLPPGSRGLDRAAVMKYTSEIFALDGEMAYRRAVVCGKILSNLNGQQRAYLAKLKFADYTTWPEMPDQLDKGAISHGVHVLVMTYASEMFSWYAGSVEADTYFCPERHGTYFGGFYMKDAPAMGQRNYTISTSLTGDSGENFLAVLSPAQRQMVTGIVDLQRSDLDEIVRVRRSISQELRKCMKQGTADKADILSLSKRYGELDGEMSYYYATRFSDVASALTAGQKSALVKLRDLDMAPSGAFIYSEPVPMPGKQKTDFLFTSTTVR